MKAIIFFAEFQYQKGAIKTVRARPRSHPAARFQYQKGAIKTHYEVVVLDKYNNDFNTKKVRLKPSTGPKIRSSSSNISIPKRCD